MSASSLSSPYSILTIVKGRRLHLQNLLLGVSELHHPPAEIVIVHMNEPVATDLPPPGCVLRSLTLTDPDHPLPLAAARNRAARSATTENLLFLDVDCIPAPDYGDELLKALKNTGGLVMGDVRYLPAGLPAGWSQTHLQQQGLAHPRRPGLQQGDLLPTAEYHLFWSLSFAISATDFDRIDGFDESYVGYGGEDTDFAFSARAAGIPFALSGARCYHQHHPTCTPPYNHLKDIVTNARAFHRKWKKWPMEGWLDAFVASGHLIRTKHEIEILRLPSDREIAEHRSEDPFA